MKVPVSIIIHALNEETNLPYTLRNVIGWADQVCVVDSESSDNTKQIALESGADVFSRPCSREGLVKQRNWALENIEFRNEWVFVLDADEIMEDALKTEVEGIVAHDDGSRDGYWCRFKLIFMGKWIPRSSMYPSWSLRLFRHRVVRYEHRDVNSHPLVQPGREGYLLQHLVNEDRRGFAYYLKRLDEFSTLEARAFEKRLAGKDQLSLLKADFFGTRAQRRRFLKNFYIRLPFRPVVLFCYLYFIRLGFLEGSKGFHYAFFKLVAEWATSVKMIERSAQGHNDQ